MSSKKNSIPIHTANFGGQMLNQESIEDLDDSKKKPALDVTFKPDFSPTMKLQKLIET